MDPGGHLGNQLLLKFHVRVPCSLRQPWLENCSEDCPESGSETARPQEHFKKLEKDRFEADLKEAQEAIAHMGSRLHSLESGNNDGLVVELDEDLLALLLGRLGCLNCLGLLFPSHRPFVLVAKSLHHFETMVEIVICWYLPGEIIRTAGFCAARNGFRPPTVLRFAALCRI